MDKVQTSSACFVVVVYVLVVVLNFLLNQIKITKWYFFKVHTAWGLKVSSGSGKAEHHCSTAHSQIPTRPMLIP